MLFLHGAAGLLAAAGIYLTILTAPLGLFPLPQMPRTLTINDTGLIYSLITTAPTVSEALARAGIPVSEGDLVSPSPRIPLSLARTVTILRPNRIEIIVDGAVLRHATFHETVGGALEETPLVLGALDRTDPPAETALVEGTVIRIIRTTEQEITETNLIPPPQRTQEDPAIPYGKRVVRDEGAAGKELLTWRVRYEEGGEVARKLIHKERLASPRPILIAVGTKIEVGRTTEGGASWYAFRKGMFAASTMFPRGTFVRVTNLLTNTHIIVRINDYGPDPTIHPDRVIDLEATAFRTLAPLWKGLIPVRVEELL